jgi:hypothetical protein
MEPLGCTKSIDGSFVMSSRPSVPCFDEAWYSGLGFIVPLVVFYAGILPAWFAFYLRKNQSRITSADIVNKFGALLQPYKFEYSYWEIFVFYKKFFIIILPWSLAVSSSVRILACVIVLISFLILEELFKPYAHPVRQQLHLVYETLHLYFPKYF